MEYDAQGNDITKGEITKEFAKFWRGKVPVFYTSALWQSQIFFPQLIGINPSINYFWTDTLSTEEEKYHHEFNITKVEAEVIVVHFKGVTTPLNIAGVGSAQAMLTEKGSRYEGDLFVDKTTFLILKAELTTISELSYSYTGGIATIITKSNYSITNTVSDRSKK